jgi:DNA-binding FadR family transcriptional regulator
MKSFIVDARKHFSNKNKLDDLLQRHRDIYNALMARNPELASEMIRKHFDFVIDNSDN